MLKIAGWAAGACLAVGVFAAGVFPNSRASVVHDTEVGYHQIVNWYHQHIGGKPIPQIPHQTLEP